MSSGSGRRNLAPAYQLALDLEAQGLRGGELAERLGVPEASLPSLLSVAHAKQEAARTADSSLADRPPPKQ